MRAVVTAFAARYVMAKASVEAAPPATGGALNSVRMSRRMRCTATSAGYRLLSCGYKPYAWMSCSSRERLWISCVICWRRRSSRLAAARSVCGSSTRTVAVASYTLGTYRAAVTPATRAAANTTMASHFLRLQTSRSQPVPRSPPPPIIVLPACWPIPRPTSARKCCGGCPATRARPGSPPEDSTGRSRSA